MIKLSDWTLGENKAKQSQFRLAPRPALGVEKQFEKTNPICRVGKSV